MALAKFFYLVMYLQLTRKCNIKTNICVLIKHIVTDDNRRDESKEYKDSESYIYGAMHSTKYLRYFKNHVFKLLIEFKVVIK
jgi:hypothetical protein